MNARVTSLATDRSVRWKRCWCILPVLPWPVPAATHPHRTRQPGCCRQLNHNPRRRSTMYGNTNNAGMTNEHMSDTQLSGALASRHEETLSQLSKTVSQAEDLLRALGDESGEAIDAMRIRVSSTLRDARTRLAGRAEQAKDRGQQHHDAGRPVRAREPVARSGHRRRDRRRGRDVDVVASQQSLRRERRSRLHLSGAPK